MIAERVQPLNSQPVRRGDYVLYWMQQSQRVHWNHALAVAIEQANELKLPLLVGFGLTPSFPEANYRHYYFMMEGLVEVAAELRKLGAGWALRLGSPDEVCLELAQSAALVISDRGYLRIQREWRRRVAENAPCAVWQVESDVVVPVEVASSKEEYAARTLRPKIVKLIPRFIEPVSLLPLYVRFPSRANAVEHADPEAMVNLVSKLPIDFSVSPSPLFRGGTREALRRFDDFLEKRFERYATDRSNPGADVTSGMSPYLHFGQISAAYLAWRVWQLPPSPSKEAFLEELIVRRELSMNFVFYNPRYDSYDAVPEWAKETLEKHAKDPRPQVYTLEELESSATHDPFWNAAQRELVATGSMHNYMRMYWGKKLIEWTRSPQEAFAIALYLNNKYQLDGRDPNSFAGVAWCFGKHDRPWPERPIYGTVRTMTSSGLERKFDMSAYIARVNSLNG